MSEIIENYIHPIYGPCIRRIEEPKKEKTPMIWIPKKITQVKTDTMTGKYTEQKDYKPFAKRKS